MTAYYLARPEDSRRWELLAEALQGRLGPGHERIAAWFHQALGLARQGQGDYRRAAAELELARALKRESCRRITPTSPSRCARCQTSSWR